MLSRELIVALLAAAREASGSAYAPYSNIRVGASLLLDDGSIVGGANVENSSYGLAMCAERTAVGAAVTRGYRTILAIAVTSPDISEISPCGACRQVLMEFCEPDTPVFLDSGVGKDPVLYTMEQLLPNSFRLKP
jgi:cytidine deaminase